MAYDQRGTMEASDDATESRHRKEYIIMDYGFINVFRNQAASIVFTRWLNAVHDGKWLLSKDESDSIIDVREEDEARALVAELRSLPSDTIFVDSFGDVYPLVQLFDILEVSAYLVKDAEGWYRPLGSFKPLLQEGRKC